MDALGVRVVVIQPDETTPAPDLLLSSSEQADPRVLDRLAVIERACLAVVAVVAAAVLCGWLFPAAGSLLPEGWALMKANTAVSMLLASAALSMSGPGVHNWRRRGTLFLGGAIVVIAGSALFEHASGRVTALDTLLAADSTSPMPGRMSVQTSIFLVLLGLTLIAPATRTRALGALTDVLLASLVVMTLIVLSGYFFGAAQLFGQSVHVRTSPQTLVCMMLLAFVAVGWRARYGYFRVLLGAGIGSRASRALLPLALIVPFVLVMIGAYVTLLGWLSPPYAAALMAVAASTLMSGLVIESAWRINALARGLRDMSLTDELTGAFNRRGFDLLGEQAVREARRADTSVTVLFFDLDDLKQVNDRFGHEAGSRFVADVAGLLRATFRGSDIVARIGGDEFAVITHGNRDSARAAVERMDAAAAAANLAGDKPYTISYSVGEATRDPVRNESFYELVIRADTLMYERKRAKKLGGDRARTMAAPRLH